MAAIFPGVFFGGNGRQPRPAPLLGTGRRARPRLGRHTADPAQSRPPRPLPLRLLLVLGPLPRQRRRRMRRLMAGRPANGNASGSCSVPLRRRWATTSPSPSPTAPTAAPPPSCNSNPWHLRVHTAADLATACPPRIWHPQYQPDHRPALAARLTATPFGRRGGSRFPVTSCHTAVRC